MKFLFSSAFQCMLSGEGQYILLTKIIIFRIV